jgi:hypothetical protein
LGWISIALFFVIILLVRPIGVLLSTLRSNLNWREKAFISWVGPKGIVAAAVASLFSLELVKPDSPVDPKEAELLLPLVFLVIVGTVVFQGSTAKYVASLLGVRRKEPKGILIVGANELARRIGLKLKEMGVYVLIVDTSAPSIAEAKKVGLRTLQSNILSDQVFDDIDLSKIGKLVATTSNSGLNDLACKWFEGELGTDNVFRLASKEEADNSNLPLPKNVLFNSRTDFVSLVQMLRGSDVYSEFNFHNNNQYEDFISNYGKRIVPMFLKGDGEDFELITGFSKEIDKMNQLIYIKKSDFEIEEGEQINSETVPD